MVEILLKNNSEYNVIENNITLCSCLFDLQKGEISDFIELSPFNEYIRPVFLACLNKMDINGVKVVTCKNENLREILINLGFIYKNSCYALDLEGYFSESCENEK